MKVLLTGASGFLGRYVLDCLRRQRVETVALGRRCPANADFAEFVVADLLTTADLSALVKDAGATHLLHLAWYAEHGKYWDSPLNLRWVDATTRLVEAFCQAGGQQVVVAGSCAEYDWPSGYCREDATPLAPVTLYGTAKDAARRLVTALCAQHQVACAWGRVFLPFGTGESCQRLIPALVKVLQKQREPFGVNAASYRDFLHAADVAEGFFCLLRNAASGAYNISSGEPVRIGDLVCQLALLLNADPRPVLELNGERCGEPALLVGENTKLKALGWRPAWSLAQGLERTVRESP